MQTVYAHGGGDSRQKEVADVVFTDTGLMSIIIAASHAIISGGSKNRNSWNPPKFTKSGVYINQILLSATKSSYTKRKLSKSYVSSHEINGFHEIQYCLRNPRIRMHSTENIDLDAKI